MSDSTPTPKSPGHVEVEGYPPVPLCVLCPQCLGICTTQPEFSRENPDTDHYQSSPYDHHRTEGALRDAASAGCVLCQLVLTQFIGMRIYDKNGERKASLVDGLCCVVRLTYAENLTLMFYTTSVEKWNVNNGPGVGSTRASSVFFSLDPVDWSMSPLNTQLIGVQSENITTGTPQCLHLAKHWLKECEQHSTCRHPVPGMETLPRRLVQIWKSEDRLHARVCQDVPSDVRYATLSHRWGPNPTLRLLEVNADGVDLFQKIPIPQLEQVFQEAITVTWSLGLTYLWIDTLCIKQNCPTDWAAQSANMGAIYKNAVVNIASASSDNGDGGLFAKRDPFLHFSPHIFIRWSGVKLENRNSPVTLQGYYTLRDSAHWYLNVSKAPLNKRGWVSQERELSPSILTFGRQQLFWKCGEVLACESFPNGIPGMSSYHMDCTTRSFRDLVKEKATPDSIIRLWYGFVHRYSATDLTRRRDRLPAAFGMAQELSRLMPRNRFLAGLWESHLAESLIWRIDEYSDKGASENADPAAILKDFQVASWSWASLDRAVMCDAHKSYGEFRLLVTAVEDGLVTLWEHDLSPNPFVLCNRLKITCENQLLNLADVLERTTNSEGIHPFRCYPDITDRTIVISRSEIKLPTISEVAPDGTVEQRKLSTLTMVLPILLVPHWDVVVGLLVNPSSRGKNVFSRVGTFEAWFKEGDLPAIFPGKVEVGEMADQATKKDHLDCVYLV